MRVGIGERLARALGRTPRAERAPETPTPRAGETPRHFAIRTKTREARRLWLESGSSRLSAEQQKWTLLKSEQLFDEVAQLKRDQADADAFEDEVKRGGGYWRP